MNSSNTSSSPSVLIYAVFASELLIDLLALPLSALNAYVVATSPVLHLNLKLILSTQSLSMVVYAVAISLERSVFLLLRVDKKMMVELGGSWMTLARVTTGLEMLGIAMGHWIGVFLVIERTFASVRTKDYENMKSPVFNCTWMICLVLICAPTVVANVMNPNTDVRETDPATVIIIHVFVLMSLTAFLALGAVLSYNRRKYKRGVNLSARQGLSERYQLSENIRTSKQLSPVLLLHFVATTSVSTLFMVTYHGLVHEKWADLVFNILNYTMSATNFAIQVLVLTQHPFLRRQAYRIIGRIFLGHKTQVSTGEDGVPRGSDNRVAPTALNGNRLINPEEGETAEYFKQLDLAWQ